MEFVDEHGNEVLNLGSFTLLPQHVVRLILAREELRADEFTKFQVRIQINIFFIFDHYMELSTRHKRIVDFIFFSWNDFDISQRPILNRILTGLLHQYTKNKTGKSKTNINKK